MNNKLRIEIIECHLMGIEHSIALIRDQLRDIKRCSNDK